MLPTPTLLIILYTQIFDIYTMFEKKTMELIPLTFQILLSGRCMYICYNAYQIRREDVYLAI